MDVQVLVIATAIQPLSEIPQLGAHQLRREKHQYYVVT